MKQLQGRRSVALQGRRFVALQGRRFVAYQGWRFVALQGRRLYAWLKGRRCLRGSVLKGWFLHSGSLHLFWN